MRNFTRLHDREVRRGYPVGARTRDAPPNPRVEANQVVLAATSTAPRVSAVIPTYNRAHLLPRAVKSVLAQTMQDFEIIIVDDCSSDETEAVVKTFQAPRLRYVKHERRLGGADARNTGISIAVGDFIAFLDSDDEWFPAKLEHQLAHIGQCGENPSRTLYFAQSVSDDGHKRIVSPNRGPRPGEAISTYLFQQSGDIQTISILISRRLCQQVGFTAGLQRHQDWDFYIRLEMNGASFCFLKEPLSIYHRDPRPDRIGSSRAVELSENWLARNRNAFSDAAAAAFRAEVVAPRLAAAGSRILAMRVVLFAQVRRAIGVVHAAKLYANILLPAWAVLALKHVYGRVSVRRFGGRS